MSVRQLEHTHPHSTNVTHGWQDQYKQDIHISVTQHELTTQMILLYGG